MTLREIKNYITSSIYTNGLHGITASVMQKVLTEIVNFFSTKGVIVEEQGLTDLEKSQVRTNIDAVGVAPTDEKNILIYGGKTIYPRTNTANVFKGTVPLEQVLQGYLTTEEQELTGDQKNQARKNIGAIGVISKSADQVTLRDSEGIVYPQSKAAYIEYKGTNLETFAEMVLSRLQDLNTRVSNLEG